MAKAKIPAPRVSSAPTVTSQLTTIFTPPPSCSDRVYTYESVKDGVTIVSHSVAADTACYPHGYSGQTAQIVYSPGVCPEGWKAQFTATEQNTATSLCCPSGMAPSSGEECASWIYPPATIALDADRNTTITSKVLAFEWYLSVEWASSDLHLFLPQSAPILTTTGSSSVSSSSTSSAARTRSALPSSTSSPGPTHSPNGNTTIGTATIVGIAVGGAAVFLLILTLFVCCILRSRKKKRQQVVEKKDGKNVEINIYPSNAPPSYVQEHDPRAYEPAARTYISRDGSIRQPEASDGHGSFF